MNAASWKPLDEDVEGALELFDAAEAAAREAGNAQEADAFASRRAGIQKAPPPGAVLRGTDGRPIGFAIWSEIGHRGRRVSPIFLAKEYQTAQGWTRFLTLLLESADPAGRVLLFNAPMPGFPEETAAALLYPRGFRAYHRFGLVFPPGSPLPAEPSVPLAGGRIRPIGPDDLQKIAELNTECYAESIDRFIFATYDDAITDARSLLNSLFEGRFGAFLKDESFGLELDGSLRGVTLVTRTPEHKLLADVEVHPRFQGRGHARRLIRATLEAGLHEPTVPLALAVTRESDTAYRLYQRLGFVVTEGPFTLWANPVALGIPEPPAAAGMPGRLAR